MNAQYLQILGACSLVISEFYTSTRKTHLYLYVAKHSTLLALFNLLRN